MERKVVICHYNSRIVAAILENGKIVELHFDRKKESVRLGDIYIAKVKQILPNIHGAFVEIANQQECYYATDEKYQPIFTSKIGKKPLCIGDELLVQIQKEAAGNKKPVVTGNLNFTGKYVVLTSGNQMIGASGKLSKVKKQELISFAKSYEGRGYGLVLRTNAGQVDMQEIEQEIQKLEQSLLQIKGYAPTRTCFSRLWSAPSSYLALLRDISQLGLEEIVVEEGELHEEIREFLTEEQPEDLSHLRCYKDTSYPMASCYSIEHTLEHALSEKVRLNSGAYLVIQQTEAMHVIDVNSGKSQKKKENFLAINKEAARAVAKQIRLRNLSGIIMVDFINLDTEEAQKELLSYLQNELNADSNPGNVIDMTKLQLTEITRKKTRKTLRENYYV